MPALKEQQFPTPLSGAIPSEGTQSMKYFVYILKSEKDQKYYIGRTNNLDRRLRQHQEGLVKSTKNRRPLILVYTERLGIKREAERREREIKSYKGGNSFKKLILAAVPEWSNG